MLATAETEIFGFKNSFVLNITKNYEFFCLKNDWYHYIFQVQLRFACRHHGVL